MKKCVKLVSVMLVICMILSLFGACVKDDNPTTTQAASHSITVAKDIANGKVTVDKSTAKNGETVKVTATPDDNYVLTGITANGKTVENGQFVMGDEDVVVSATFALNTELFEQNPGVEGGTSIKAPSMGGGDATAQIFTKFGDKGVEFTAYVVDSGLSDKDGVAILFSKKMPIINQLLPNGQTIKLEIRKDGTATLSKTDAEGKLVADTLSGSEISLKLWTKDGKVTTGYIVRAVATYEALGVTKDTAKGNITVCPVIYNAYGSVSAKATALNGANENAQNTYPILSDDDTYLDNPFMAPSGQLGSDGGIMGADTWDLSKDYYKEDTENYPNRVAILDGHDALDNNLVFVGVSAAEMYAEATIRVIGAANPDDQWPKFGLMLFNGGSQSGLFYYVDAIMKNATGNTEKDITGTALGYNKGDQFWSGWNFLKDGVFDLSTLTIKLQMVYQDGWAHLYANDQFIDSVFVGAYDENMHFGFKSFGLKLEVTNYMASTDAEADGWAHLKREKQDAEKLDILFAGDSYMDFWKNYFYQGVNLADYTNSWANEGIGGTQVPLWIEKAADLVQRYDPKNIVFHIGVNDIDSNVSVEQTVANLKTLFETYHELFPNAKIYWNELIPNTMFANKVPEYYQVNEQIKAYAEGKDWLVHIEQAASFEKEPGVADPMYFYDGIHLSNDIGYPIWAKNMLTAMGYTYEDGTTMGNENGFVHSGGWTYTDGTAYLNVGNEMITYFKGASGEMVYVESMVTIGQLLNNDGFPKFGYVLHGTDKSLWGLVDCYGYPGQKLTNCAFVVRDNVSSGGYMYREGWNWDKWIGGTAFTGSYSDGNYIKMAVAKLGNDVYLLVNGQIVARTTIEGEVTIGFQVFNLETTIKDVVVVKDEATIREKLGLVEPINAVLDGKADDAIWTEEVLSHVIKTGDKGDGRYFETVAVKAPEGVYFLVTTYSYENNRQSSNWWENANIEFRMGTDFGPQYYVYYKEPGFAGEMGWSVNVAAAASDGGVQLDNGLWKATMEFLVPYGSIAGCDANTVEIPVNMWGWVFDEAWQNGMCVDAVSPTVSEHGLRYLNAVNVAGVEGVTVTPSKNTAAAGETVELTIETDGVVESVIVRTVSGVDVPLVKNYSFVMPNEAVTIWVKLEGAGEVDTRLPLDILFAGDSYMDFWNNEYFFQSVNLADYTNSWANEGIGGTMVPLWIEKAQAMANLYNPKDIVFHIGVNDIDNNAGVETTVANLKTMFEKYHELFPEARIFWNGLIPNTMFASRVPEYYQVNEQVKAYAEDKDWLTYIDQAPSFEKEPGVANPLYFYDGLHMSADIGYPIWAKNMLTAMGYTYEDGTTMGNENGFVHSGGWTYTDGTAHLNVGNEMVTYFKGGYGEMVYVEAMVTIGQLLANDAYPKFGYVVHGSDKSLWGFVDAMGYPGNYNTFANFVARENVVNGAFVQREGWNWNKQAAGSTFEGNYANGNYIKMAVAKLGSDVYLLVNDKIVARTTIEGEVTIGFQVFNLEVTVKDAIVIKDESTIKEKLGLVEPSSAVLDGKADDAIWTEEVLGNAIQMGHIAGGRYFETVAVKAPEGVYFLVTTYSYENTRPLSGNWWENANIEFRIGNDFGPQVYVFYKGPGFNGGLGWSSNVAAAGCDGGVQLENGLWKSTMEFLVPYDYIAGCDVNTDEIPVSLWGWVFDEGWHDGMNGGTYPALTISEHGLRFHNKIEVVGNNSAVTITPSKTEALVGETVELTIEATATIEKITVKTVGGQKVALVDNKFVMPNEAVIIEVTLQGISVVPGISDRGVITCEAGVVAPGQAITFTVVPNAGFKTVGVTVNGEALTLNADGSYTYTVKDTDAGVNIEAQFDYDTEGWNIDGIMDENEAWGEELRFLVEGNRAVSVWAVKGENGVYFYVRAYTDTMINTYETEWYTNHNFEFYLNHGEQSYVNTRNEARGASKWIWNSVQVTEGDYAGKWMHTTELFVKKDLINGFADGDVTLNYAFKASWENARWEGIPNNQWDRQDWWRTSLGSPVACETDFAKWEIPNWLKITSGGIVNTKPAAADGVIDAELDEYEGKYSAYAGNENAYFHVMGYEAQNGVYLAFEIWQKNKAAATPEWHLNDNLEIKLNGVHCGFSIYDDFVAPWGHVNAWSMKQVESDREGYAYKTVVEMFVKMDNVTGNSYLWVGCNGDGFGGWQSLFWDDNLLWVTADGIADAKDSAVQDGVTVDGKGDEAFYEGKKSVTFTPNGATVEMIGAKLKYGTSFLFTVTHTKSLDTLLRDDGNGQWFGYLNFEIYVGEGAPQAKASVWNNYTWWCACAFTSTDNGDGTYTTVMEVYVPYGLSAGVDISGDVKLGLGTVIETGYAWCAVWDNNLYLTENGVEYK